MKSAVLICYKLLTPSLSWLLMLAFLLTRSFTNPKRPFLAATCRGVIWLGGEKKVRKYTTFTHVGMRFSKKSNQTLQSTLDTTFIIFQYSGCHISPSTMVAALHNTQAPIYIIESSCTSTCTTYSLLVIFPTTYKAIHMHLPCSASITIYNTISDMLPTAQEAVVS